MDIYCPKCGEPWELDTLHDEVSERLNGRSVTDEYYQGEFRKVMRDFQTKGCMALDGGTVCAPTISGQPRADIAAVAYELLGDDIDGAASMLDDAESMGLFG